MPRLTYNIADGRDKVIIESQIAYGAPASNGYNSLNLVTREIRTTTQCYRTAPTDTHTPSPRTAHTAPARDESSSHNHTPERCAYLYGRELVTRAPLAARGMCVVPNVNDFGPSVIVPPLWQRERLHGPSVNLDYAARSFPDAEHAPHHGRLHRPRARRARPPAPAKRLGPGSTQG